MKTRPLLIITGPTASGKSALALQLCNELGGEIVSCDSMQIYRGCDIATAKPTLAEQSQIRHHLLDICNPNERFSAAQWASMAKATIEEIEGRGKVPIVCGGTGFYLRALLEPQVLSEVEPNEELRASLEQELAQKGATGMHEKLAAIDPPAAARLHPNDSFRVLRALEVAMLEPFAKKPQEEPDVQFAPYIFGVNWAREVLYERINNRVDTMLHEGMMDELKRLMDEWGEDAPALGGVGYKQMRPAINDPLCFDEGVALWKQDTRRYAKRQMTWFRHQLQVEWLEGTLNMREMVQKVVEAYHSA